MTDQRPDEKTDERAAGTPDERSDGPKSEPAAGTPSDLETPTGEEPGSCRDLSDEDLGDAEGGLGGLAYAN